MNDNNSFVQINVAEYDRLKEIERGMKIIESSEKNLDISIFYNRYDPGGSRLIVNQTQDVQKLYDELKKLGDDAAATWREWVNNDKNKRIMPWHIFRKIKSVV